MSMLPAPAPGVGSRGRRLRILPFAALLAAMVVAGCGTGTQPSSPASDPPSPPPSASVEVPVPSTSASVEVPSEPTAVAGPPVAMLAGPGGSPVAGDLGSYTWAGAGSDSPWIVPPADRVIRDAGPFVVTFEPGLDTGSWTARWAPVTDGAVGDTAGSGTGDGSPISIAGPDNPGSWSLQLEVRFADGNNATWYWRLEPGS